MTEQVFADEVGDIFVTGAIVRFDLMIHSATEREPGGKPKLVLQQRVIMPIDAFLRAAGRMQGSVDDMMKKGLIKRAPKDAAEAKDATSTQPKK